MEAWALRGLPGGGPGPAAASAGMCQPWGGGNPLRGPPSSEGRRCPRAVSQPAKPVCIFQLINPAHKALRPRPSQGACARAHQTQIPRVPLRLETRPPIVPRGPAYLFRPCEHSSHTVSKPGRGTGPPQKTPRHDERGPASGQRLGCELVCQRFWVL